MTGLTLKVPWLCEIEVPLSVSLRVGLEALEAIETLPLKLPADCGAKVTIKDVLCPGVRVKGVLIPEILNPVPEAET